MNLSSLARGGRRRRTTTVAVLAATVPAALLLGACSPVATPSSSAPSTTGAVPHVSEVDPLADPRSWTGLVDISLPGIEVAPVHDPTPDLPVTVTDAQGTRVTVEDASRILALDIYGTLSQTVFELGLGDRVVGRDTSSQFDEIADRPLVTSNGHELNAEAILALDPTVVLTDTSLGPWDVVLQLRDAGIPVVVTDSHRGLDNLASLTGQVADALGVPAEGEELGERITSEAEEMEEQIAAVVPKDPNARLRTVFLYVRGSSGVYYMFGQESGADSLIEAVGGYDVSAEIGWKGMRPLTDEGLVSAQPDVVLMMSKGLESVGGVEGLLDRFPALAQTPAGENERVVAMDDDQVLSYGPRTADVLNALAVALYAPDSL
ncbi:iron complex transport system substrate-binding protein [Nocardioides cavernae]|uniref:Iron complex transport system substrate-binding protein n=1 Tax=Nocardioides cavernae TaxID=1921566 RepID=A0A7Y9H3P0_9ACTN|nr:ABC transporter substrate-binding protein [Nocardioides cavernae]NYE37384.1 iron complex transport system substrate-binding protein [Nocardioides cavernae]